ncbi:hypothetical protein J4714_13330 [Staphylococcus epidermidis]|nr:hypothetical protein [Staphylococcus epidermidis]
MLDGWGDHPVVAQTVAEASDALGEDIGLLIQQGPKETPGSDYQHPASDAGGGCGCLARVAKPKAVSCLMPWLVTVG